MGELPPQDFVGLVHLDHASLGNDGIDLMPPCGVRMKPSCHVRVGTTKVFLCIATRQLEDLLGCLLVHFVLHVLLRVKRLGNLVGDVHRVVDVLDVLKLIQTVGKTLDLLGIGHTDLRRRSRNTRELRTLDLDALLL